MTVAGTSLVAFDQSQVSTYDFKTGVFNRLKEDFKKRQFKKGRVTRTRFLPNLAQP